MKKILLFFKEEIESNMAASEINCFMGSLKQMLPSVSVVRTENRQEAEGRLESDKDSIVAVIWFESVFDCDYDVVKRSFDLIKESCLITQIVSNNSSIQFCDIMEKFNKISNLKIPRMNIELMPYITEFQAAILAFYLGREYQLEEKSGFTLEDVDLFSTQKNVAVGEIPWY